MYENNNIKFKNNSTEKNKLFYFNINFIIIRAYFISE